MPKENADTTVSREVTLAVRQLNCLSVLPAVAARFLSGLFELKLSPLALAEIIESEPALAAAVFSLAYEQDLKIADEQPSIRRVIEQVPLRLIRDKFLSAKVYWPLDKDLQKVRFRKQLALHAVGVACCAEEIAELSSGDIAPQLAYAAGLLHSIGNLALDETMPRSFAGMVEQAKSQRACICTVQNRHFGLDYTILGKRLAERWHLPEQIALAVWLHQSNTEAIAEALPEAKIACLVRLAYLITRQCSIGDSGSYDTIESPEVMAEALGITSEQLEQIRRVLPVKVSQKAEPLAVDSSDDLADYCHTVQNAAAQLAKEGSRLEQENRRSQTKSSHFDFATEFLTNISSTTATVEVAEKFACHWQKFYQTGKVCLYLAGMEKPQNIQAVIVESANQSRILCLHSIEEAVIPQAIRNDFNILDARGNCDWLFEQLDTEFDIAQTKMIPVLSRGKAIGAIVFEFRYPVQTEQLQEMFKATSFIAGTVLDMAFAWQKQQHFAEQFARLVKPKVTEPQPSPTEKTTPDFSSFVIALAEMAAGAAHELNNPLSVIRGKAQLLIEAESDPQKQESLKQIAENTGELAGIIEDLMSFAEPAPPRRTATDVKQLLDEAIQLTSQKTSIEHINSQIEIAETVKETLVDSAQIVSAIANILSNAIESYSGEPELLKIAVVPKGDFVKLQISDFGCGMDGETLKKATYPFFSAKPAGRKRGMGLAYAARLIQLNGGSMDIVSKPGSGTTVTVTLPLAP